MRRILQAVILAIAVLAAGVVPAAAQAPAGLSSENVEFVGNILRHTDTAGAVLRDGYYYITTERDLSIYDVRGDAEHPLLVGNVLLDRPGEPVFTEEDPTTNGRILVVSNTDTLVYDVSDKAHPVLLSTLAGVEQHTLQCVLDCTWVYGSEGAIVDLRDPSAPKLAGNWAEEIQPQVTSTHDVTEVAPGILMTSSEPLLLLDARSDPVHPRVVATATTPGFAHANLWPHGGTDDFLLVGGEATGPQCADEASATFMTFDARTAGAFTLIDEFRMPTGTMLDGRSPDSTFCVHWFSPHPTYANGGMVAIAWYEQGTRFLRIDAAGQISEVGHYLPTAGQASDVDWITDRVAYISDYLRGLDIVRYTGEIPPAFPRPALGTPLPAAAQTQAGPAPARRPRESTPSSARLITLPSTRRCVAARGLKARIGTRSGDPVVAATLQVGRRVVARARGAKALRRGLRSGRLAAGRRITITAVATTRSGRRLRARRTYRVCGR